MTVVTHEEVEVTPAVQPEVLKVDAVELEYVSPTEVLKVDVVEVEYVPTFEMSNLVAQKHVEEIAFLKAQDEEDDEDDEDDYVPVDEVFPLEPAPAPVTFAPADVDAILAIYKSDLVNARRKMHKWIEMTAPSQADFEAHYEAQIAPLERVIEALHEQGAKGY